MVLINFGDFSVDEKIIIREGYLKVPETKTMWCKYKLRSTFQVYKEGVGLVMEFNDNMPGVDIQEIFREIKRLDLVGVENFE